MSSIVEQVVEKITGKPATAEDIAAKLAEANAVVVSAEARHVDLSYKAALGEVPESKAAAALGELRAARDRVVSLTAALGRHRELAAERVAKARAEVHRSQLNACRQHLSRRDAAAAKMSEHLQGAITEFQKAVQAAEKALAAAPGAIPPAGSMCERVTFSQAVRHELFRLSAPLMAGLDGTVAPSRAFPGALPPDIRTMGEPDKQPPLAEQTKAASDFFIATLTGRPIPASAPQPASQSEAPTLAPAPQVEEPAGQTIDARNYVPRKVRMS